MNFAQTVKKNHQDRMEASKIEWIMMYPLECKIVRQREIDRKARERNVERIKAIEKAADEALEAAQIREMMEA